MKKIARFVRFLAMYWNTWQKKKNYTAILHCTVKCHLGTGKILSNQITEGLRSRDSFNQSALSVMLPKHSCDWDVSIVIKYLNTLFPLSDLSLKSLSCKSIMLLALLTSERGQTLHLLIAVDDVVVEKDYVEIRYSSLLKKKKTFL